MKIFNSQRGQSLVEVAITMVIMLVLLLSTFEFGYAFLYYITIKDAAEEGAIYGSLHPSSSCNTTLTSWVHNSSFSPVINISDPSITTVAISRTGTTPGNTITVTVTHRYSIITPLVSTVLGRNDIDLHASVTNTILTNVTTCN